MPRSNRSPRTGFTIDQDDIWTPGDVFQMDAVVAACALVAQADGWVTVEERKRMVDRMRQSPTIAFFGAKEVVLAFEALNLRFDRDVDDGVTTAEAAVRRLQGRPGPSRLLVETACSVAEADGGFDGEERAVILRLCHLLNLDPARFDIVAADGARR